MTATDSCTDMAKLLRFASAYLPDEAASLARSLSRVIANPPGTFSPCSDDDLDSSECCCDLCLLDHASDFPDAIPRGYALELIERVDALSATLSERHAWIAVALSEQLMSLPSVAAQEQPA